GVGCDLEDARHVLQEIRVFDQLLADRRHGWPLVATSTGPLQVQGKLVIVAVDRGLAAYAGLDPGADRRKVQAGKDLLQLVVDPVVDPLRPAILKDAFADRHVVSKG